MPLLVFVALEGAEREELVTLAGEMRSACPSTELLVDVAACAPALADHPLRPLYEYAARVQLTLAPGQWHEVDRATAERIVTNVIWKGLAYSTTEIARTDAAELTRRWLALVDRNGAVRTRTFTNGTLGLDEGAASWSAARESTFDTGIVAVADGRVGHVWVEDED